MAAYPNSGSDSFKSCLRIQRASMKAYGAENPSFVNRADVFLPTTC